MNGKLVAVVLCLVVALSGCARLNSIHRTDHLPWFAGKIVHTDAKQRALLAVKKRVYRDGSLAEKYWQFCTEPPPDVFSALASSLSARGSLSESADPLSKEIAGELSTALSENAASIERTQTVNILRESMYRTCERFLSGGIGTTEFIVQSARDQRAMIAILAIEQLTGVQKSHATALTTVARAATDGVSEASLQILEVARNEAESAKQQAAEKRQQARDAEPEALDCDTAKTSDEAEHAAKKEACEAADALEAEQAAAEAYFATIMKAVENQSSLSAEAKGALHSAALNGSAAGEGIADRVVDIVRNVNDFDEIGMTCVVIFRLVADSKIGFADLDRSLKDACIGRVIADAELSAAERRLEAAELKQRTEAIEERLRSTLMRQAGIIWRRVFIDGSVDQERLDGLIQEGSGFVPSQVRRAMLDAGSVDEFAQAFGRLSPDLREAMAAAAGEPE